MFSSAKFILLRKTPRPTGLAGRYDYSLADGDFPGTFFQFIRDNFPLLEWQLCFYDLYFMKGKKEKGWLFTKLGLFPLLFVC